MAGQYVINSAFQSPLDAYNGSGKRPVVFDIIGPDRVTSLLPPDLRLVLHVNPQSMAFTYAKTISRQQTLAGYVETHWGSNPTEISFTMATGGFMRLYSGLSNVTGPTPSNDLIRPTNMQAVDLRGTRRDSIAYDKYLDMLALFHNNGAIYDSRGAIAFQGQILITYDEGSWWGWFTTFSVEETAEKPYQFTLNASFTVERELHRTKSVYVPRDMTRGPTSPGRPPGNTGTSAPATTDPWESLNEDLLTENPNQEVPSTPNRTRGTSRTPGTGGSSRNSSNRGTTNTSSGTSGPNPRTGADGPPYTPPAPNPTPAAPSSGQATFSSPHQDTSRGVSI